MRAAPNPRLSPGGLGPHLTSSGFPCGLSSGFPFARRVLPLRPPSSGLPSSGGLRFGPFGRCPVPVPRRFPSGFPFPWAIFTLARSRGGSAGVGPGRQGPRSPALSRTPRLDRAMRPHSRWAAAGHDGMLPQNRLLRAAAERRTSPRPNRASVDAWPGGWLVPGISGAALGYWLQFPRQFPRRAGFLPVPCVINLG